MKQISKLLIAVILFTAISPTLKAQVNTQDSLALVDLYDSTNGANWKNNTNWLTTSPLNTWNGIVLDSSGRVSQINLYINNLTGTLPSSIGNLTQLTSISLHINAIGGDIPASIGNLTNLIGLDLGENKFTGTIPDSLANLTKLTQLDLDGNQLTGAIPSWIGNLTNLQDLWLHYNSLSDSIPSSIGNLKGLQYLVLQNNQLSGPIPASFGNLNNLQGLFLQNNKFTFDGMELIATKFPFAQYSPQAVIPLDKAIIPESGPIGLSVEVGGTSVNNTYKWYNDSGLIATINKYSFYNASTSGYYYVQVTDSLVPGLTLHSDTVKVDVIVPIKSITLQAKIINGQVNLQWKTINEFNIESFTIQHSTNCVNFTDIGTADAVGYGTNNYSLVDKTPAEGVNYYRIKSTDATGSVTYSSVVKVLGQTKVGVTVYPNPVTNHTLNLQIAGIDAGKYAINIYSISGQRVSTTSINVAGGSLSQSVVLPSAVKAGTYQLELTNGSTKVVKAISVQ